MSLLVSLLFFLLCVISVYVFCMQLAGYVYTPNHMHMELEEDFKCLLVNLHLIAV